MSTMCDQVFAFVWRLCDGGGWKSTYRFSLDRYQKAALTVRPRLQQPHLSYLADQLRALNDARMASKGKAMTDDHVKQEAGKIARTRLV